MRPNQGNAELIGARTVNVYLPTKELVEAWKEARKTDLSLSRFVVEVVERYHRSDTSAIEPAWNVEEGAKALVTELEELGRRYDILCRASAQQEKQLQQFSHALERASESSIDPHMARRIIGIFRHGRDESISAWTILGKLFINDSDGESIAKVRHSLNLLQGHTSNRIRMNSGMEVVLWKAERAEREVHLRRKEKARTQNAC